MSHLNNFLLHGGVSSSLGKGIIAASLAKLLQAQGYKTTIQKLDPYINVDPGTLNPYEHVDEIEHLKTMGDLLFLQPQRGLYHYFSPEVVAHDEIIQGKESWLNKNAFILRGLIYIGGWSLYRYFSRKFSLAQDNAKDNKNFKRNFQLSAGFLVFFKNLFVFPSNHIKVL